MKSPIYCKRICLSEINYDNFAELVCKNELYFVKSMSSLRELSDTLAKATKEDLEFRLREYGHQ
jgi:hypothetical protein